MKDKILENIMYISLACCIIAQIVIGPHYIIGQGLYFIANTINVIRTFGLRRPLSDKIRDVCFLALTGGLIGAYYLL